MRRESAAAAVAIVTNFTHTPISNLPNLLFHCSPGWYGTPGDVSSAASTWSRLSGWSAANYPGKPFTVSETGGGGVYEWRNDTVPAPVSLLARRCGRRSASLSNRRRHLPDPQGQFWSQKYQAALTVADATFLVNNNNVSAFSLWLLHDFKVDDEQCGQCVYVQTPAVVAGNLTVPWDCAYVNVECGGGADCLHKPCGRPAGMNHKGAVDFWRRKKESFDLLAAVYK